MKPDLPYASPQAPAVRVTAAEIEVKRRFWKRAIRISVGLILIPPLIGFAMTLFGMVRAFNTLGETGKADPQALAGDISSALMSQLVVIPVCIAGIAGWIVSLIRYRAWGALAKEHAGGGA